MATTVNISNTHRSKKKVTSIGRSVFTHFSSKNDKRNKKYYRGQG